MSTRVNNMATPNYSVDLDSLSLIVLTHEHKNHLDMGLIKALAKMGVQLVISIARTSGRRFK